MAYAFIQQNSNDNAATATTITVTLTPTAGNLLVFALAGDSQDTTSIALSDNLGTHNTFTQIATDIVSVANQRISWWYAENCKSGATTFTATFSATTRFRAIYVAEYSGIATSGSFLNGARAEQAAPLTLADAVTSGNANATSQPALVWGLGINVNGGTTPTAGTGFTSRAGVWSTATCLGRPEDKRVTATGNVAATLTATTGTDPHATGVGIFAEATATPTVSSWGPSFPDRFPARSSVSALGVAVAPVLAIALAPLCWAPSFPDRAPARPVPNLATGSAVEPVFVPPAAPAVTPMSWSPTYPDQLRRAPAAPIVGGSFAPEATLANPPAPSLSWTPGFPDFSARARQPVNAGGMVAPVAPNSIPSLASWAAAYTDSSTRARSPRIASGVTAPTLPIPDPPPSVFPLTVSSNGRHLRKKDGAPFLVCADSTWSLFVDIPLTGAATYNTYFATLVSQGFNSVMGNAIEHHFTVLKPPLERGGLLPFTQRMDAATFTGSPNGTSSSAGTQAQFASDNYGSPSSQSPDCTFINNSYWLVVEQILDAALANGLLVFVWPSYLGFHAGDEGWMGEMVVWDAVIGAGGFTGAGFADPTKSKMYNYGAWLAARWKNYPNIVWTMGGDYGSNSQTLSAPQRAAVVSLVAGMKSVAGQKSLLWTAHWDRPCISDDNLIAGVTWDINFGYCDEAVAEVVRGGYSTAAKPSVLGEYNYENGSFGGTAPWRKYTWWGFLGGVAGGFYGHEQLWRFDDGTPGIDWTTLLATQARLDVVRQFAFWNARPWWRMKPNGLGGMGTLITAGGGTASPQSTDYVAAACTPEGDLLIAYVPPAHTGSVTVDMTKLGASVTARWFDPANATFTAIGTFANTGTRAFTTTGNNSAGDADWLLVLDAPDAPMPLSWGPSFPDRAPRLSLGLAQVVSGGVEPVAPPPPATLASWSPDFPDQAYRARQPVNVGGSFAPDATLPNPVFSWVPSFPDRLTSSAIRLHSAVAAPPPDTNAGPLTWLSQAPDLVGRSRAPLLGGEFAPLLQASPATVTPLSWSPAFPDFALRARQPVNPGGLFAPEATLVNQPAPALSWSPDFADFALRARQPINVGGSFAPTLTIANPPAPPLSWSPGFPDRVPPPRAAQITGGAVAPAATIPNPPAPPLSWAPSFPDQLRRPRAPVTVGGSSAPEATIPNPVPPPSPGRTATLKMIGGLRATLEIIPE